MLVRHITHLLFLILAFTACRSFNTDPLPSILYRINHTRMPDNEKIKLIQEADSLAVISGNDSAQLSLHIMAGELYLNMGDAQNSKGHFQWAVDAARKKNDQQLLAAALNNMAIAYDELFETDSALKYYREATAMFRAIRDSLHLAQSLVNMSILYKNKGEHGIAVTSTIEAAKILEKGDNKLALSDAYSTLGNSLKAMNRLDLALSYHEKALAIRKGANDSVGISGSLNNIANIYRYQQKYDLSLQRYFEALAIKERTGNRKSVANTIDNIAAVYLERQQFSQARMHFEKALSIRKEIDDKDGMLTTINRLCRLFIEINDLKSAAALAKEGETLSRQLNYIRHQIDNTSILTEINQRAGRHKIALEYALRNLALKDSLMHHSMTQTTSEAETRFRTREKEHQLALVSQLKDQQALKIRTQHTFITILIGLLCLLIAATVLLIRAKAKVNILFKELAHRIDNNLQILLGILLLKKYNTSDPGQREALNTIEERINAMISIHNILKAPAYNKHIRIRINEFISALVANINSSYANESRHFNFTTTILPAYFEGKRAITIGLLINEILTNLYKHGRLRNNSCEVNISLQSSGKKYTLSISDDCEPWEPRPAKESKGMGLIIIETLSNQLKGKLTTESTSSSNTITLVF